MEICGYRNRRGALAIRVDDDGPLVLENGRTIPGEHPAWEYDDDVDISECSGDQIEYIMALSHEEERAESIRRAEAAEARRNLMTSYVKTVATRGLSVTDSEYPKGREVLQELVSESDARGILEAGAQKDREIQAHRDQAWDRMLSGMENLITVLSQAR